MTKAILAGLTLLVLTAALLSFNNPLVASSTDQVHLEELLASVGKQNDVTFTIEEAILADHAHARFRGFHHQVPAYGTDLQAILQDLSRTVPDFTWQRDANNPKIIHVIDGHLLHWKGYALDRTIDEINFAGTVSGLVDAIAAKGVPLSPNGLFGTPDLAVTDFASDVQVEGTNLRVRDALSDFIPLQGRGPILWFAETHTDGSDGTSYIRFRGAPPKKPTPGQ